VLLAKQAAALKQAGLGRVTVSLDTLRPERMRELARTDRHADVLAGIAAARSAGFRVKLNTVVIRGVNEDELIDLVEFARAHEAEVRFIEYMDVGGATGCPAEQSCRNARFSRNRTSASCARAKFDQVDQFVSLTPRITTVLSFTRKPAERAAAMPASTSACRSVRANSRIRSGATCPG